LNERLDSLFLLGTEVEHIALTMFGFVGFRIRLEGSSSWEIKTGWNVFITYMSPKGENWFTFGKA